MLLSKVALAAGLSAASVAATPVTLFTRDNTNDGADDVRHAQVIILGGGITGISLARSLIAEHNITDVVLIEARDELGGRAHTETLHNSITGENITVEKGCNWIQGPGKEPIQVLAKKWGLKTNPSNYSNTAWFEGLGIEADGERGHFLDEGEQEEFMAAYDNFLENAPGYSGEWSSDDVDEGDRSEMGSERLSNRGGLSSVAAGELGQDVVLHGVGRRCSCPGVWGLVA